MEKKVGAGVTVGGTAVAGGKLGDGLNMSSVYRFEARDKHGNLKWVEEVHNDVVTEGLNHILDSVFDAATQITAWYVGLTDGTPTVAAGDTMASHAGWVEVTAYDESVRQTLTLGTAASGSIDNTASKAVFTVSTNSTTIGGAFITSVSTKGGATGTLYSVAAFSAGDKALDDDDTLTVTVTLTAASA